MTDKIAEIRARHARHELVGSSGSVIDTTGFSWTIPGLVAHADRATLLAEVDRLRADLATQHGCCDGAASQDAHVRQEREEHRAEVERLRAEIERMRAEVDTATREREGARAGGEIRPAVYVLLSDDRGEDHDGLSDEICGCYLSREAAERAGNELNVRWRIEEYGLEGKP